MKLRKYSTRAKLHHSYILGTVLHPCLRSHWFAATADPDDAAAQEEAIRNAEVVFKYIAETYLDTPTPSHPPAVMHKPIARPVVKTSSFLASACSFQRPITAATTTPTLKRTPREELAEELTRYFDFEAAPIERQEGEEGCSNNTNEPSAPEVLLNPLLWWKIHATDFPIISRMARDYLAIPATSVAVERVFSKSRHICSNLRSSLKETTITMALLTKVWIRSGLFEMMPPKILRRKHGDNGAT
ncbi:hypothetical protein M378DRAFT_89778 [Amanita muscaria Koide BX008]|uniref:HAT C-terminal dimerisation domain-containing protein n=1 Tax=Amanita muscaria (strain Koide BX008) TaxID=946122 RepID=A0A0C2W4T9_AMAMK|nr:hypothetical protein M378DRAFT_89778 [Amanita muscaria Koide BX008]